MWKQLIIFKLLIFSIELSSAQHFANNACPDRPVEQNFDLQKYISHSWYEILRFDVSFEEGCNCGRATYGLNSDNSVTVTNCCKRPNGGHCSIGKAVVSEPDHEPLEAKLNVTFGQQPNKSNYWILSTDYDNYSIVYYCKNIQPDKSVELAWLLSAKPKIDESIQKDVDELMNKYFDKSAMYVVDQSETTCN